MKRSNRTIADQLRMAIADAERRGLTRYRIAQQTGIAQSTLSQFVNGTGQLRLDIAERIARQVGRKLRLDK